MATSFSLSTSDPEKIDIVYQPKDQSSTNMKEVRLTIGFNKEIEEDELELEGVLVYTNGDVYIGGLLVIDNIGLVRDRIGRMNGETSDAFYVRDCRVMEENGTEVDCGDEECRYGSAKVSVFYDELYSLDARCCAKCAQSDWKTYPFGSYRNL